MNDDTPRNCSNLLGATHYRAGNYKRAVSQLNNAIAGDGGLLANKKTGRPSSKGGTVEVWLFLAMAHQRLGQKRTALECYHKAIQELSHERLNYAVKDRIVDCSRHLIPQTRERFVMVGIRSDVTVPGVSTDLLPDFELPLARSGRGGQ